MRRTRETEIGLALFLLKAGPPVLEGALWWEFSWRETWAHNAFCLWKQRDTWKAAKDETEAQFQQSPHASHVPPSSRAFARPRGKETPRPHTQQEPGLLADREVG